MIEEVSRIMVRQRISTDYVIRIARDITEVDDFFAELQVLATAGPEDTVEIQIVSGGGYLDTGLLIAKAIYECAAPVTAWIGSTCASAATVIALACDEWKIDDMSSFMIHTGSYGLKRTKAPDIRAMVDHESRVLDRLVRLAYDGFLTEDEIERVLEGRDYYFQVEELADRLQRFAEKRDQKRNPHNAQDNVLDNVDEEDVESAPVEAA